MLFCRLQKERDLELAARIGQQLLNQNQSLETTNSELETQLQQANETIQQLRHDIAKKNELLKVYYQDVDEDADQVDSGIACEKLMGNQLEALEKKLSYLEEENLLLKSEVCSWN
jgi:septal ring factor EnvC (AmiA/AmiB activator)